MRLLTASDSAADDEFGISVVLDGPTAVFGAPFAAPAHDGAVYVFVESGNVWSQEAKLTSSPRTRGADFGFSVAKYRSTAGAPYCCPPNLTSGAAFVFLSSWRQSPGTSGLGPMPLRRLREFLPIIDAP